MFKTLQDFISEWEQETAITQRAMDQLTDEAAVQKITSVNRSLGQLGWHLAVTIHEMLSRTGLVFEQVEGGEEAPASAAAIAAAYRQASQAMLAAVKSQWTDENLLQSSMMYDEEWPNGLTLQILIKHEIHHRGQMTVLVRQAGLVPPDVYGPTREDWLAGGMQPML
ncbi:DinB family protein [Paenibacillus sp. NPDC058071]|uniref:DinB family protein n=1 Tax=Paenibacillus sp. NPDC058071 TaxID=3346326 RepID=UPI0036DBE4FE